MSKVELPFAARRKSERTAKNDLRALAARYVVPNLYNPTCGGHLASGQSKPLLPQV